MSVYADIKQCLAILEQRYPGQFQATSFHGHNRLFDANDQGLCPRLEHATFAAWLSGFLEGLDWMQRSQRTPTDAQERA